MTGYSTREVAEVLGVSPAQVRSYARSGFLDPERGPGHRYRFSFTDIVLLRTARELRDRDIPPRRVRRALERLGEQLPAGRPLSAIHISAEGDRVVVRDRDKVWEPETGQVAFDFSVEELASRVEPFAPRVAAERGRTSPTDADGWYDLGVDLEAVSVTQACEAYGEALTLDPAHAEAHLNLGRLLHERGELEQAEAHYRRAGELAPDNALAAYNLGVVLEDENRIREAKEAYRAALVADPELGRAHFNLARLCERSGDVAGAVRHLAAYRRLGGGGAASGGGGS
jgi:tetratricopeptide (TPR) repeat protein